MPYPWAWVTRKTCSTPIQVLHAVHALCKRPTTPTDIHALFMHYNALYFEGTLDGPVSVEWSTSRMTRCAGVCKYSPLGGARIVLSMPLLQVCRQPANVSCTF